MNHEKIDYERKYLSLVWSAKFVEFFDIHFRLKLTQTSAEMLVS